MRVGEIFISLNRLVGRSSFSINWTQTFYETANKFCLYNINLSQYILKSRWIKKIMKDILKEKKQSELKWDKNIPYDI